MKKCVILGVMFVTLLCGCSTAEPRDLELNNETEATRDISSDEDNPKKDITEAETDLTKEDIQMISLSNGDCRFYPLFVSRGINYERAFAFYDNHPNGIYSYEECIELIEEYKPVVDPDIEIFNEDYVISAVSKFDEFYDDSNGNYYMEIFHTAGDYKKFNVIGYNGKFVTEEEIHTMMTTDQEFVMVFYKLN